MANYRFYRETSLDHKKRTGLWAVLNAPFVITLIGSLLIAGVTQLWQFKASNYEMQRARSQSLQDRRYEFLCTFSEEFPKTLILLNSVYTGQLWLDEKGPDVKNDVGMTRAEVWAEYKDNMKLLLHARQPSGLIAQARALFPSKNVVIALKAFEDRVEGFDSLKHSEEVDGWAKKVAPDFENLLDEMGKEMRSSSK